MKNKITFSADIGYIDEYQIVKMGSVEKLMSCGNTERFSKVIADKWLLIRSTNTGERVYSYANPHIKTALEEARVDGWRVDNIGMCIQEYKPHSFHDFGVFVFNDKNGSLERFVRKGAKLCLICGEELTGDNHIGHICKRCLTKPNGLAYRFSYHDYRDGYPIKETIDVTKTPVFGAEIERDYVDLDYSSPFNADLREAMLDACSILYEKDIKTKRPDRKAVFMSDGSLHNGGIEWITFPQTLSAYNKESAMLQKVIESMASHNFKNSSNCGNHIHINANFFGKTKAEQRYAGAKMALIFNAYWSELTAIAERTDTHYCSKPNQQKSDHIYDLISKTERNRDCHGVAVNLQHDDTIELRLWSGINNVDDLLLYLDMSQAIAKYAKKKSLETIQRGKFMDILQYITYKKHFTEIKKRLNHEHITRYNDELDKMMEKVGK